MKSSSAHYPVSLVSTEIWMGYSEDVYLLKTNNSDDKSVELALTRLYDADVNGDGQVFVFVHDTFENRNWWFRQYEDLLLALLNNGADIWLFDMRGHGLSPKNRVYQDNTLNDIAAYDLPAVQRFVDELHPGPACWVGAGEGAIAILRAVEANKLKQELVAKVHALDMTRYHWKYRYWIPGFARIKVLLDQRQYFYRQEKEDPEFRGVWRQLVLERALFGGRKTLDKKHPIIGAQLTVLIPVVFWIPSEKLQQYATWRTRPNIAVLPYAKSALIEHLKQPV